jgi:hypothetical protein
MKTTKTIFPVAAHYARRTVLYVLLGLAGFGGLSACEQDDVKPRTEATEQWVLDRLYFGRSMPEGGQVTQTDWDAFLAAVVTPRFPDGLTVWQAEGQWQEEAGQVIREGTFILEVVHPKGKADDDKLEAIIAAYKERFRQESVLRVTHPVNVQF